MTDKSDSLSCGTCTIDLVRLACGRNIWFRMIRAPLALSMRLLGSLYGIQPYYSSGHDKKCRGCIRFTKIQLKERSAFFIFFNSILNPLFDRLIGALVTAAELRAAKETAAKAACANGTNKRGRKQGCLHAL